MRLIFLTLILLATLPLSSAQAATLHVSKSGDGTGGSSWENAFIEIGDAIEAATSGDEIWVASGVYNESLRLSSGFSLLGGFSGRDIEDSLAARDPIANETVIDATSLNKRCILILDATDVLIDGFKLRNAKLEGDFGASGGGIALARGQMRVLNCRFCKNFVGIGSNGFHHAGGGMYVINSFVDVENCSFVGNSAADTGGAVFSNDDNFFNQTTLRFENCLFDRSIGTAVDTIDTQVYLQNCTFGLNSKWSHNFRFDLDTFPSSGPVGATITNCIIRDNLRPGTNVTYSNVLDYPGEGNIDMNPGWFDRDGGNFHLRSDSPCIDSGTDVEILNDLDGNPRPVDVKGRGTGRGFDMGCYEFQLKRSDLNENGKVDGEDLLLFQEEWMREGEVQNTSR